MKAIRIIEGTKITHDHWEGGQTFDYDKLVEIKVPAIGIPAQNNGLVIIDVDTGDAHAYDGRQAWGDFAAKAGLPITYTVQTASGGFHFYFKLPAHLDLERFSPVGKIFPGVDVKYRGYVLAPPTKGYTAVHGALDQIAEAPPALLAQIQMKPPRVGDLVGANTEDEKLALELGNLGNPLSPAQIEKLRGQLAWVQQNVALSYDQWFRGLCSLKAGLEDPQILEEFVLMWTLNQGYSEGDEQRARAILKGRKRFGGIGPGAIFEIIKDTTEGNRGELPLNMLTKNEIIEQSGINFTLGDNGVPKVNPCETNIAAIINVIPMYNEQQLYYDLRMDSYILRGEQVDDQFLADTITPILQSFKNGLGFQNFKRNSIASAIQILLTARRKDPHQAWLKSLVWDGVERIASFFPDYIQTKDSDYERVLGSNMWIALAARGLKPGCKMDNVLILEGPEGIRKSSIVEAIAGKYYIALSTDEKLNSQEALKKMHQAVVVEVPELIGLINRGGQPVKAILTTSVDKLRNLYARRATDRRRGFLIIGTTNDGQYLTRDMGERRFWPVKVKAGVKTLDTKAVERDREQLFAEGVHRFNAGESYWEVPKDLWRQEIDKRKHTDPLQAMVLESLEAARDLGSQLSFTVKEIYELLYMNDLINKGLSKRVSTRIEELLVAIKAERKGAYWSLPKKALSVADLI